MFEFAHQSDGCQPCEALPDPLAFLLTDLVAGVARATRVDRAAAPSGFVLRHLRSDVHLAAFIDEPLGRKSPQLVQYEKDAGDQAEFNRTLGTLLICRSSRNWTQTYELP